MKRNFLLYSIFVLSLFVAQLNASEDYTAEQLSKMIALTKSGTVQDMKAALNENPDKRYQGGIIIGEARQGPGLLHYAAFHGNEPLVHYLISILKSYNETSTDGCFPILRPTSGHSIQGSPAHAAALGGHKKILEYFINHEGAKIDDCWAGTTYFSALSKGLAANPESKNHLKAMGYMIQKYKEKNIELPEDIKNKPDLISKASSFNKNNIFASPILIVAASIIGIGIGIKLWLAHKKKSLKKLPKKIAQPQAEQATDNTINRI